MERSHILGVFILVATIAICTFVVVEAVTTRPVEVRTIREVVVTPTASPSAQISPSVSIRRSLQIVPTITPRSVASPTRNGR